MATGKSEDESASKMSERLRYEVIEWSSYSAGYHPRLIMENKSEDLNSRWLSETGRPPQYVLLQLTRPAVTTAIVFGKYHRPHACNAHKIKILGGMDKNALVSLNESELKNDGKTESVHLRHTLTEEGHFPCLYIKIVLLDTFGQTNFSLWYVELLGCSEPSLVRAAARRLKEFQEQEALRLCLKHLRQHDYQDAYHALSKQAYLDLEHPLLTQLHTILVEKGEHSQAENLLSQAAAEGLLDRHISDQPSQAVWQLLTHQSGNVQSWPGVRGGHQLCLDINAQLIYMFGGWDGSQDLADFWVYDIERRYWKCLCRDASEHGGPSPRSCHKMCLDAENQILYIIGRYVDQETRASIFTITVPGDFYSYHIATGAWHLISSDTHNDNGPRLLYDHQVCFNPLNKTIYVFGGRVITSLLQEGLGASIYSGLYAYKCLEQQWVCLKPDYTSSDGSYPHQPIPRMAHTMVLYSEKQQLYILGGQRDKQPLCDMWVYSISSDTTSPLADGTTSQIPAAGFTVRATLDPIRSELYLHVGMSRHDSTTTPTNNDDLNSNSLCHYSIESGKWSWITSSSPLPCPRFAHQLVFDPVKQVHYMFGGNPGGGSSTNIRLDDFWTMKVQKHNREKLLQDCVYMIRKQRYRELIKSEPTEALRYLKTVLAECVNHSNTEQSEEFRALTSQLFIDDDATSVREMRSQLFDELSSLFPQSLSQPRSNLINFIDY